MSALITRLGYDTFELFSFTAIGIPVWLIVACYLLIAGCCLPDRGDQSNDNLQALSRDGYLTEVVIPQRSPLCEVTLHEIRLQCLFKNLWGAWFTALGRSCDLPLRLK